MASFLIYTFLLTTTVHALTTVSIPYGTMIVKAGEARTYFDTYEVVIVRSHPRVVRTEMMKGLIEDVIIILDKLESTDTNSDILLIYHQRLKNLAEVGARSKRWAPLEPLGEIVGSVFGLATTGELEETRDRINTVISTMSDQAKVIKRNDHCSERHHA